MHTIPISGLIKCLQNKEISSLELIEHFLNRIEKYKYLNAFINTDQDHAIKAAKHADVLLKAGNAPILTGIPLAHKDIFCTQVMPTTCASKMLENFISPYDATVVSRFKNHGAIMLGKANMDEFGMGSTGETSYFGPTLNPWNKDHISGGSSSGSAAAVAMRLVSFATATDTGGSTRQPSAFCGVTGIKPTYGLVSRYGQIAYASSFDQTGLIACNAHDLAITTQVIAGFDENDSTTSKNPPPNYTKDINKPFKSLRIGIPSSFDELDIDIEIKNAINSAINVLKDLGAEIINIDLNLIKYWLPCYYLLVNSEASPNLARYDGIRYGYRAENYDDLQTLITKSRSEGFGSEVKKRILTGSYFLESSNIDGYYFHAQKVRTLITQELVNQFKKIDFILGPTTPTCAFKIGECAINSKKFDFADVFTVAANLAGLPAISLPVGFSKTGLPIGMQLMGDYFCENKLFRIANLYQNNTEWHKKIPNQSEAT